MTAAGTKPSKAARQRAKIIEKYQAAYLYANGKEVKVHRNHSWLWLETDSGRSGPYQLHHLARMTTALLSRLPAKDESSDLQS